MKLHVGSLGVWLVAAACLGPAGLARAQETIGAVEGLRRYGPSVEVVLDNGDRLKGSFTEITEGRALIDHPVLGRIGVPIVRIDQVLPVSSTLAPAPPAEEAEPPAEPPPTDDAPADEDAVAEAADDSFVGRLKDDGWTASLELGFDGSNGNTTNVNLRTAFNAKRETDRSRLTFSSVYVLKRSEGDVETDNRFDNKLQHDWLFADSPWEVFARGDLVIDRFRDYDYRWSAAVGPGYKFIDTDRTFLIGRAGIGASQEIGGPESNVKPELFFGYDFTHDLTERWALASSGEIFPDLDETGEFRSAIRGGVDYKLSNSTDLRLKAGAELRHESDVDPGTQQNDVDYFLSLVLGF